MSKKEFIKESLEIVSELASKTHKQGYELDLSDLESPEQAFARIYGESTPKATLGETLRLENATETEKMGNVSPNPADTQVLERPSRLNYEQSDKGTACLPCTLSHASACVGLLNEAVRFARDDIANPEVSKRVDNCLSEIAAAERGDLIPENIQSLPPGQKKIAEDAAIVLRDIRHDLEWWKTKDDLENIAAKVSNLQHGMSRKWRMSRLSDKEKEEVKQRAHKILDKELEV